MSNPPISDSTSHTADSVLSIDSREQQKPRWYWPRLSRRTRINLILGYLALLFVGVPFSLSESLGPLNIVLNLAVALSLIILAPFFLIAWMQTGVGSQPRPPRPETSPTVEKSSRGWTTAFFLGGLAVVFMNAFKESDKPHVSRTFQPQRMPQIPQSAVNLQPTLAYWNQAVATPYRLRFEIAQSDEPTSTYYTRRVSELQSASTQIRALSSTNVDQDLLKLVHAQLEIDEQFINLYSQIQELSGRKGLGRDRKPVKQRVNDGIELFQSVLHDPEKLEKINDPEMRALLEASINLELEMVEAARQTDLMQAVLQERYRGQQFLLPSLEQERR